MRVALIVYGEESGIVRRIVVADLLAELTSQRQFGDGEGVIVLDADAIMVRQASGLSDVPDLRQANALVAEKLGRVAEVSTVAVIDNATGEVTGVISADPALDEVAGCTLYQHEGASIGATLDENGDFQRPESP